MKKNIIFLTASILLLWLAYIVIKPLNGEVFIDPKTNKPKDFVSAFIQKLDQSNEIDNPSLEDIKHIKLIGGEKQAFVYIEYSDTAKITELINNRLSKYNYKKTKDSLIINLNQKNYVNINIVLNPNQEYSLTLDKLKGGLRLNPGDSSTLGFTTLNLSNNSSLRAYNSSRENQYFFKPISLNIEGKSKIELENIRLSSLNVKLNNGLFVLENTGTIDSLNADLQGLSNIIVGKYPEDKRVKSLALTGDLDYYNKRKPK